MSYWCSVEWRWPGKISETPAPLHMAAFGWKDGISGATETAVVRTAVLTHADGTMSVLGAAWDDRLADAIAAKERG